MVFFLQYFSLFILSSINIYNLLFCQFDAIVFILKDVSTLKIVSIPKSQAYHSFVWG